jgi:hypothetical protein
LNWLEIFAATACGSIDQQLPKSFAQLDAEERFERLSGENQVIYTETV